MAAWYRELGDVEQLKGTIERLARDGELSPSEAQRLTSALPTMVADSAYILRQLGAHLAIGFVFMFDVIPLPLGTISRGLWVSGNWCYERVRGKRELAKVHSLPVLVVSLIPFIGYFAYLIPLRRRSADAPFVLANHITYRQNDCHLRQFLSRRSRWVRKLVSGIVGRDVHEVLDPAPDRVTEESSHA